MTDPRKRAIDRVRKLLSLSRSQNEHEAATAAETAARIMAQHGIDSDEIEAAEDPIGDNQDLYVEIGKTKGPGSWKWNLAWHVAEAGGCKPYVLQRKIGHETVGLMLAFIGRRSDAQLCVYLLGYLIVELKRFHKRRLPSVGQRIQQYVPGADTRVVDRTYQRRWSRDFYLGGVVTLASRMKKAREDVMTHASETSLVLVGKRNVQIDETADAMGLQYTKAREIDVHNAHGYAHGVAAGERIDLSRDHPQIGEGQLRLSKGEGE